MTALEPERGPVLLVVEDEEDVREMLGDLLTDHGYKVVTAEHGGIAQQRLDEGLCPALIILDLMMPVVSGLEFWEQHRDSPRRNIPVLIHTASVAEIPSLRDAPVLRKTGDIGALLVGVTAAIEAAGSAMTVNGP